LSEERDIIGWGCGKGKGKGVVGDGRWGLIERETERQRKTI
jgi:hypothetical protein